MTNWTAGYVSDITYTYGYYPELNPVMAEFALTLSGYVAPKIQTACELGFGQGVSANIHSAASKPNWWGTDFNPSQASFAQDLAETSGTGARLFDDSFEEFANRSDLPEFDYIALHGIWSWISDHNRQIIRDFIRSKLKIGGVLYISYNTFPGWAAFAPVRHLITEHAEVLGSEGGGIISRIDGAMDFALGLLETNPSFSKANPMVGDRLKSLKDQNRHYLAHEYFNKDWHPMHFATMADWLDESKVQFCCSANLLDLIPAINLSNDQQRFLNEIPDMMFRESVRDFIVNQQFRKDYWVKGSRKLDPIAWQLASKSLRVILTANREDIKLKVKGALGEANMNESVYVPILDYLADHQIRSIGEIADALQSESLIFPQVIQAIQLLVGAGHIAPAQCNEAIDSCKQSVAKLNEALIRLAMGTNNAAFLASPVTGGGVGVSRIQQLFIQSILQGNSDSKSWAAHTWSILSSMGQKLVNEGKTLESQEENIAELNRQAEVFEKKSVPILQALRII